MLGGDDVEPEGVLLGFVEEQAGFDAGDDGFGPKVVEPLGPGEDGGGFPGVESAGLLGGVVGVAELAGGGSAGQEGESAVD